jgi:hypothetical protein
MSTAKKAAKSAARQKSIKALVELARSLGSVDREIETLKKRSRRLLATAVAKKDRHDGKSARLLVRMHERAWDNPSLCVFVLEDRIRELRALDATDGGAS